MRTLTKYAQDSDLIKSLLVKLADSHTGEKDYADSFYQLGAALSEVIQHRLDFSNAKITLACSSEDADWLSKGILDDLLRHNFQISLAVFWNLRTNPSGNRDLPIAPIIKKYIEPVDHTDYLIICKSIISSSCAVKTNLTYLIEKISPIKIFITAPVLFDKATENLKTEFPLSISKKFEFIYFAEDNEINEANEVVPRIGNSVYKRLGLEDAIQKNKYVPLIVKERRALLTK